MRTRKPVPVHNLKVSRKGKVKKRSVLWRMRRSFYLAALAATLLASGMVYVLGQIDLPVDPSQASIQEQTSFICAADVQVNCNASNAMAQLHGTEDRVLVTWEQIPEELRQAVVAAEDRDFFRHGGVDPFGIARAAYRDIRNQGVRQGGSTITQQYVKQEYLSSEQSVTRKIKEAAMAVKLEQQISKEEILTRYLNTVYFGRGAYGVQAASRAWFGTDVSALDTGEAAFLAGLLRNPTSADPYRDEAALSEAERRRRVVLNAMFEEEYLTAAELRLYESVPMDPEAGDLAPSERFVKAPPRPSTLGENVKGSQWGSEHFAEYVRQWLVEEFGTDAVYGGGLKVYTTLDLGMQKAASETVTTTLDRDDDPSAAIVTLDDQGQVKAMMGGTDFANDKVNLATGVQGGGLGRGPGSTFKTFALADAVRNDYSVQSVLTSPTSIDIDDPRCAGDAQRDDDDEDGDDEDEDDELWSVSGGPGGSASLVTATKNSINTTFAQLMVRLGPQQVIDTAADMGVASIAESDPFCSVVLGAGEVSVLDMAAGYSTLANEGVAKSPIVVTRVEFPDGEVIDYQPETREVLTPEQAGLVTHSLQEAITDGTGRAADFDRPAAGKTGTTQNNTDAWFVGYTPTLTTALWVGFPQGLIPMEDIHGVEQVQGGTLPAEMWREYMETVTANRDTGDFPELSDERLAAGEALDPELGTSSVVAAGDETEGAPPTIPPPTTAPPEITVVPETDTEVLPETEAAPEATTVPEATVPETETVPETTAPETTVAPEPVPETTPPAEAAAPPSTPPAGTDEE
ncbi:hypothetical protein BH23ACT2_BH23ACT2_05530 [soil metagenome]